MRTRTPFGSATGSRSKTCTDPVAARSKPRMCLMSVVLPAPLAPTSPKTVPRGTVRLTLSSATLGPKRRVISLIWITASIEREGFSIMECPFTWTRLHGLVALAKETDDLFGADVHLASLGQQGVGALGENLQALAPRQRGPAVGHVSARRAAFGDDTGNLQLAVSAGDRVGIHEQLFGEHTDGRQFLPRRQPSRRHEVFHLVHDLQVDRHAVVR